MNNMNFLFYSTWLRGYTNCNVQTSGKKKKETAFYRKNMEKTRDRWALTILWYGIYIRVLEEQNNRIKKQ